MLERLLGQHTRVGQITRWYGEKALVTAAEITLTGRVDLRRFAQRPQIGGLTDAEALERFKVYQQNPGLRSELKQVLAKKRA
jgi:hypothetical protein